MLSTKWYLNLRYIRFGSFNILEWEYALIASSITAKLNKRLPANLSISGLFGRKLMNFWRSKYAWLHSLIYKLFFPLLDKHRHNFYRFKDTKKDRLLLDYGSSYIQTHFFSKKIFRYITFWSFDCFVYVLNSLVELILITSYKCPIIE